MTTKPSLNAPVFSHQLDKLFTLLLVGMIQPATSIYNMIFLQNSEPTSIRGGMRKDEDLPSLIGRMVYDKILKPVDLCLVDGDFVRCVDCIAEDGRSKPNKEGFVGNLAAELWSFFVMSAEIHLEVFLVGFELVGSMGVIRYARI